MMENMKKSKEKAPHKYSFMGQKELSLDVMGLSTEKTGNGRITVVCLTLICHTDSC